MRTWPIAERALVARSVLTFHGGFREELPRGLLIGAGRILGSFDPDDRAARRTLGVDVTDLGEAVVVPGFIDAHNHQPSAVFDTFAVPTAHVRSTRELLECLDGVGAGRPPGSWLVTEHALSVRQLTDGRAPLAAELDQAGGEHMIAVRLGAHAMSLNTRALIASGIAELADDPPGGVVERDQVGRPTGVIREYGATGLVLSQLPPRPRGVEAQDAIRATQRSYARSGVTSVRVTGLRPGELALYHQTLVEDGWLATRVFGGPRLDPMSSVDHMLETISSWPVPTGFGGDWLGVDAVKVFVDDGIETLLEHGTTELLIAEDDLTRVVVEAAHGGWSVACHAVNADAVGVALAAFGNAASFARRPLVLEHGFGMTLEQLRMMSDLGVWWSTQPAIMGIEWTDDLSDASQFPLRTALGLKVACALGSDWNAVPGTTIRPFSPIRTIQICVERAGLWGQSLGTREALPIDVATFLHTRAPALLLGRSDLGGIFPGAHADLAVLDSDLADGLRTSVIGTFVGGEEVSIV